MLVDFAFLLEHRICRYIQNMSSFFTQFNMWCNILQTAELQPSNSQPVSTSFPFCPLILSIPSDIQKVNKSDSQTVSEDHTDINSRNCWKNSNKIDFFFSLWNRILWIVAVPKSNATIVCLLRDYRSKWINTTCKYQIKWDSLIQIFYIYWKSTVKRGLQTP